MEDKFIFGFFKTPRNFCLSVWWASHDCCDSFFSRKMIVKTCHTTWHAWCMVHVQYCTNYFSSV